MSFRVRLGFKGSSGFSAFLVSGLQGLGFLGLSEFRVLRAVRV